MEFIGKSITNILFYPQPIKTPVNFAWILFGFASLMRKNYKQRLAKLKVILKI